MEAQLRMKMLEACFEETRRNWQKRRHMLWKTRPKRGMIVQGADLAEKTQGEEGVDATQDQDQKQKGKEMGRFDR